MQARKHDPTSASYFKHDWGLVCSFYTQDVKKSLKSNTGSKNKVE